MLVLNDSQYPYQISRSKRARYLRIKLSPEGEVTLVIPKGVLLRDAESFLDSKKPWLESHLKTLPALKPFSDSRPESLQLSFLDEYWVLEYADSGTENVALSVDEEAKKLTLTGCIDNKESVIKALGQWLKLKAEAVLPARLGVLAEKHGFHFQRVTIRGQKTRWGSCSSKKNINLNYKLLFLEQSLVDYVLIHELCHTLEMNHSKRFWALVSDCDANYQQHDRSLNVVGRSIPI